MKVSKKVALKFLLNLIISYIIFHIFEHIIFELFEFNSIFLKFGWIGWVLIYGFKYHIICCLVPILYSGWKCKHSSCEHKHCKLD